MQLTSFTDYGLRALIYMASLPEGRMTSISEVTEVYGVSRNHMVKIINQLSRMGYVTAVRGRTGAFASANQLDRSASVTWYATRTLIAGQLQQRVLPHYTSLSSETGTS